MQYCQVKGEPQQYHHFPENTVHSTSQSAWAKGTKDPGRQHYLGNPEAERRITVQFLGMGTENTSISSVP